jgi:hypothetical protein
LYRCSKIKIKIKKLKKKGGDEDLEDQCLMKGYREAVSIKQRGDVCLLWMLLFLEK